MSDKYTISGQKNNPAPPTQITLFLDVKDLFVFPNCIAEVYVEDKAQQSIVDEAMKRNRLVALMPRLPDNEVLKTIPNCRVVTYFEFDGERRVSVGMLARILVKLEMPDGSYKLMFRGISRIDFVHLLTENPGNRLCIEYRKVASVVGNDTEFLGKLAAVRSKLREISSLNPMVPTDFCNEVCNHTDPSYVTDLIASDYPVPDCHKVLLLSTTSVDARMDIILGLFQTDIEIHTVGTRISKEVSDVMGAQQREFFLREQLKHIQKELGADTRNPDVVELEKRIASTKLPKEVKEVADKELGRLVQLPTASPEYHIAYTYLSWLLDVPWLEGTEDVLDVVGARRILDHDHYGLEDVKKRILEFIAVLQMRKDEPVNRAPILCLVGPPGVGKTSLGKSIARAMHRNFVRMSLGGVRDEAEIRGHRRTYVGAMPGRIVQNLRRAGSNNPVFMLDEIDKLAHDFRGDPASALLEVLDPAQNDAFNDNYIEVDCDLSRVFFIATANVMENIPGPLLDRMEVIRLPGYTMLEKREIARKYLIPRQQKENGLDKYSIRFMQRAVDEIINYYTMEAGVRSLERVIASVFRRLAGEILEGKITAEEVVKVDVATVHRLLGERRFLLEMDRRATEPGRATGLAWTGVGGVILPVEVVAVPGGKGNLKLTGSLGKVMQESAETAFSLVRSVADRWKIKPDFFTEHDFHIHVPDGATPKDGPSAGVTMTMAVLSMVRGKALIPGLAMTGEITLHGRVTAVGGIREKMVAALRAGIREIIMPEENRKDYNELPDAVKNGMEFHFVETWQEAEAIAFGD